MEVQFENITKNYGDKQVLKGISLTMGTGLYGLLGPNGAGKTTLIRILADVLCPTNGRVLYDGKDIHTVGDEYRAKDGSMEVRVIAEEKPSSGAVRAAPLEDAYLYLFHYLPEKSGSWRVRAKATPPPAGTCPPHWNGWKTWGSRSSPTPCCGRTCSTTGGSI